MSAFGLRTKVSDHTSDVDSDQRSIDSSSSLSHTTMSVSSPRSALRADDVDELRFPTLRLQVGAKTWRGHKRLGRDIEQFARFRTVVDFVVRERIVDAHVVEKLPAYPLMAAFSVRGVRVVATAESLSDRFSVVPMDKRDLAELVQALKLTKMLRAFPYSDVPDIWLRRTPGNAERTMIGVSSRYDDVLMASLRSPLVHGVLIRADASVSDRVEILTAHDMAELVANAEAHWVPYLDLVYYVLSPTPSGAPPIENTRAKALVRLSSTASLTSDVVVSIDADACKLPLDLKEAFVMAQQMDVHPLVRRIEDVRTNTARINVAAASSTGTVLTPQKVDAGLAVAKSAEQSLKALLLQSIKAFAAQLATFGDAPSPTAAHATAPTRLQPRALFTRSNTEPLAPQSSSVSPSRPELQRRRSSLATAAGGVSTASSAETYVVDTLHLRDAMRERGINMRFLPIVFAAVDSSRQPGVQTLVAGAIVARLAKTLFRFELLQDASTTDRWATRKHRAIAFIDSIMHGVFHADLPTPTCPIRECVGEQFWHVDAPTLLLLGPMASSAALDYACVFDGAALTQYRRVLRGNPSVLYMALLHALDAEMSASVLPALHEHRYVSMPFLRSESDLVFTRFRDDPLELESSLRWTTAQFFRLQFDDLRRQSGVGDVVTKSTSSLASDGRRTSDSFADVDSPQSYYRAILAHVRQSLGASAPLRLETSAVEWDAVHAVRSRLVKALRTAGNDDDESRSAAREHCDEAKELLRTNAATAFPLECVLALECLELASGSDDALVTPSSAWQRLLTALQFFYRPANQSQFAKASSSHPLFAIVYFMVHVGGLDRSQRLATRRTQLETAQLQDAWLRVIGSVDAHCRRAVAKSWTLDPVMAIATKAASAEFEKTAARSLHLKPASTSSLSSTASDERTDNELQFAKTARAMSTDSKLTAAAVRQDVLWFVESFLLPATRSSSWRLTHEAFERAVVAASGAKATLPAPGVGLVWGERCGVSLDEETQIANAPSDSKLGQLRARPVSSESLSLVLLPSTLRRIVQVACGYRHTALVTDNRQLYTFGYGECGRLGHGDEASVQTPTAVSFFTSLIESVGATVGGIAHVACGREHTMVTLVNGEVYGFGWAEAGRLGTGDTGCCAFPMKVVALQRIRMTACGREHTLALTLDGDVFAFGAGFGGRLGIGTEADEEFPVRVAGALNGVAVAKIDAGECHSAAVSRTGDVYTWGFGSTGALGTGTRENSLEPVKVSGPWTTEDTSDAMVSVACGSYHTLASTRSGRLFGWGDAAAGQLGADLVAAPDQVVLLPEEIRIPVRRRSPTTRGDQGDVSGAIREIATGTFTSAVALDDGRVFLWGSPGAGNGAPLRPEDAHVACVTALEDFAIARIACGASLLWEWCLGCVDHGIDSLSLLCVCL